MNSFTKQKQSHRCKKQSDDYQGGKGGRDILRDKRLKYKHYCI